MSDTHPRYIVAPDRLAEPPAYAVVDTQGDNGDNPEILCATTDAFASRIVDALNDWGRCDHLHDELHRMGVAREKQRQRIAALRQGLRDVIEHDSAARGCSTFTKGSCRDEGSGRTRDAKYGAEAWCDSCIATAALAEAEEVGR